MAATHDRHARREGEDSSQKKSGHAAQNSPGENAGDDDNSDYHRPRPPAGRLQKEPPAGALDNSLAPWEKTKNSDH